MIEERYNVTNENEDILIKGCIAWDRQCQNRLYDQYCAKMFAVCYRYSSSREEAEDTFHEAFMKVFENIKNFKKTGSLEGWIRRIMVNTAIEKYRKNSRSFEIESLDDHQINLNHYYCDDVLAQIAANDIMKVIDKLPPQYKLVFNLSEFEGLKHKEIAEKLGITEGTSKSNLSRAKAILQKAINKKITISEKSA
jgi:RNA polymerase sigma-70 factor (ECF subfamily)